MVGFPHNCCFKIYSKQRNTGELGWPTKKLGMPDIRANNFAAGWVTLVTYCDSDFSKATQQQCILYQELEPMVSFLEL